MVSAGAPAVTPRDDEGKIASLTEARELHARFALGTHPDDLARIPEADRGGFAAVAAAVDVAGMLAAEVVCRGDLHMAQPLCGLVRVRNFLRQRYGLDVPRVAVPT